MCIPISTYYTYLYSDQLWKLEGKKLVNKNGHEALSDVKIPEEGDQGQIKGQTTQDQTTQGQNDKIQILGLDGDTIKLEDTNSQTGTEYDWKRKKEDEEFFTLESGSTPKQFLTWNSEEFEFVIASMYYLLLSKKLKCPFKD